MAAISHRISSFCPITLDGVVWTSARLALDALDLSGASGKCRLPAASAGPGGHRQPNRSGTMRKIIASGCLLFVVSAVLGATVFRDAFAHAAQFAQTVVSANGPTAKDTLVREQNLDGDGNIKVHEQGT